MTDGFDVNEDITMDDLELEAVPVIKGTGVIKDVQISQPFEETGNQFVNVVVEYPDDSPDKTEIRGTFTFNRRRMAKGADNSDLEKNLQIAISINKRLGNELLNAAGVSSLMNAKGARVRFQAGPAYKDQSQYEFKHFYKPSN